MKNFVEELNFFYFFYAAVAFTDKLSVLSPGCAWKKLICTKAVSDNSISSKAFTLLHLFVQMRSDDHRIENQSRELFEKFKSCWLSPLHTADPSLWIVGFRNLQKLLNAASPVRKEWVQEGSDAVWWSKKDSVWSILSTWGSVVTLG